MKSARRAILLVLLVLAAAALAGVLLTRDRGNSDRALHSQPGSNPASVVVDTSPLDTATQLSRLAVTPEEIQYAQDATRLGDRSVDIAFALALLDAGQHPPVLTPETQQLAGRVKEAADRLKADKDEVARLSQKVKEPHGSGDGTLPQQLELAQAQTSLDEDELKDSQQDLVRAGGDARGKIQQLLDEHEASVKHSESVQAGSGAAGSVENSQSRSIVAQFRAWSSLSAKAKLLRQAEGDTLGSTHALTQTHETLKQQVKAEESEMHAPHPAASGASAASDSSTTDKVKAAAAALPLLQHLSNDKKILIELDNRIQTEQQLADTYGKWLALVQSRQRTFLHGLLELLLAVFLICVLIVLANTWMHRFFTQLAPERRQLRAMRTVAVFATEALGVALILILILGSPSQLATGLALAGAGLTVALQDFIVGFFGWFILMRKNGIRPGDWVEINGVGGQVLEVGPLHTVLLETGTMSASGHPTGRKVTFVNSFAIQGHYFNFSTSGQWFWDELQVQIPEGKDAYAIAEEIRQLVAKETEKNVPLAEQDWTHVTSDSTMRPFSAAPTVSVQPSILNSNINVVVRYLTRANERYEVRSRLNRAVVGLVHGQAIPETAVGKSSADSGAKQA
jgi:small-conductance mechanosensitive channel